MIEPLHPGYARIPTHQAVSLHALINQLLRHSLSEMMRQSDSSVMNEIATDIYVTADENKVVPVIQELLAIVVSNARKGRIHIRAERFRDIIILEIQDQSNFNGYALDYSIRTIEPLARMAGGYISTRGRRDLETTISFSFPNESSGLSYDC